jgi:hypothetical protein
MIIEIVWHVTAKLRNFECNNSTDINCKITKTFKETNQPILGLWDGTVFLAHPVDAARELWILNATHCSYPGPGYANHAALHNP